MSCIGTHKGIPNRQHTRGSSIRSTHFFFFWCGFCEGVDISKSIRDHFKCFSKSFIFCRQTSLGEKNITTCNSQDLHNFYHDLKFPRVCLRKNAAELGITVGLKSCRSQLLKYCFPSRRKYIRTTWICTNF